MNGTSFQSVEQSEGGGYRYGESEQKDPALRLFLGEELLPDERCLERLRQIARVPECISPIVVLPDVHLKIKNFIPSGVAVALRGAVSPLLLGPPNDSMLLACTDLDEGEVRASHLDAVFSSLLESVVMFRRRDPTVSEDAIWPWLARGAAAVPAEWGFGAADLERLDGGGDAFAGQSPPSIDEIRAAFPRPHERPTGLPEFVPRHDVAEAARRGAGVLDGGSHFVELGVIDETPRKEWSDRLGLRSGQIVVALHAGSGDVGLIAHQHHLPLDRESVETLSDRSPQGVGFLRAYLCASNFGFVNRLHLLFRVREALERVFGRGVGLRVFSDAPHDSLDVSSRGDDRLYLHRKGAVRTLCASRFPDAHPFALSGRPFYFPSALAGCGESDWVGRDASDGRRAEQGEGSPFPVRTGSVSHG